MTESNKTTIALAKSLELNVGVAAEYWRVVGAVYLETEATSKVLVAGWLNAAVFRAGKAQLALVPVELSQQLTDVIRGTQQLPNKELLYSLLQATPQFTGATPVLQEITPPTPVENLSPEPEKPKRVKRPAPVTAD